VINDTLDPVIAVENSSDNSRSSVFGIGCKAERLQGSSKTNDVAMVGSIWIVSGNVMFFGIEVHEMADFLFDWLVVDHDGIKIDSLLLGCKGEEHTGSEDI